MTRMKDSGIEWIGEVPEDWGIVRLKDCLEINNGKDYKDIETDETGYPVIGSGGQFAYARKYLHDGTAILLGRKGTIDKPLYIEGKFWTVDTMFYGVPKSGIHAKFIYYVALQIPFGLYSTNTALPSMTQTDLQNHHFVMPPLDEQTQIADFLDKKVAQLDKVKSLLEEQIKTLEDYRQSLIYETVTKGLDKTVPLKDSGVDWIGQIPEGWGVKPIKYCSRFQRGFGFPVELQGNDDGEIPFYKVSDLRGNSDEISISKNYVDLQTAKQNAWVIVPSGAIIAPVIGAALLNNNRKISTVPFISDNNTLAIIPNNKNKYFYYLFKVIDMNWFNNSSTIPAVNISKLANQIVPTPKEEEQKQIADFLEVQIIKIDKLIEIKQKQINNINQQRQTLIYDVVTGKRRV